MNLEEVQRNRFIRNFAKDKWLIFASAGLVSLFAVAYVAFLYTPGYKSEAKVWVKDTATRNYVSDGIGDPSYLSPLTSSSNPVMTQAEILQSAEMEKFLADFVLKREAKLNNGKVENPEPDTEKIITVKIEPNSDILQVGLKWDTPEASKEMLAAALAKLDETNLGINRETYQKKRQYLGEQISEIEAKLLSTRDQLKQFQTGNMAVDVDSQTQELVRLRSQLVAQLESALASRNNSAGNARALQSQLSMGPRDALNAVALGSGNENLTKMRTDLATLKQQFAKDSVKEAPTNPHLVALKKQIETLEAQVQREIKQTIGKDAQDGPLIFDNVRSQLVQDLASSNARSAALGAEVASLRAAIDRVDTSLKAVPGNRYTLAALQEEERALSRAYDELRKKQIEASIKEAEIPSNLFIIDNPSLPEKASFPTGVHILALSLLLGLGTGCALSVLKTSTEDRCEGTEAVIEATRSKVLGVVPWQPNATNDQALFTMNDVAWKHIVSTIRLESLQYNAQVLAFTSSSLEKPKLGGVYHLARQLAALGQTVAFIDADFRPSRLAEFVVEHESSLELTDMILSTDLKLRSGQTVFPDEIIAGMVRDANGVYMALNRNNVANTYEYFANKGFRHIVSVLKEQFDWVLIDTPPAAIAPEFKAIAHLSDGVILFADKHATNKGLQKIAAKIRETQAPFIGTIVREENGELTQEHELYTNWRGPRKGGGSLVSPEPKAYQQKRVEFMGAKIDAMTMQETLERISEIIDKREHVQHVVVNVAKLMTMRHDRQLREIVNNSDLINADGAGIVMGARMLGIDIPERVAGIDLMHRLVEMSSKRGYRVFFLGAEEDIVRDVVTSYRRQYDNLTICGYRNGYFKPEDERAIAEKIREARPDILFVAISSPKKEKFISAYKDIMNVPFVMGVGGSFDVVAGKVNRAPKWMQQAGMEWFYRLIQEPGRMWKRYLVTNVQFGLALAGQAISAKPRPAHG